MADDPSLGKKRWRLAAIIERPIPFYVPHYRLLEQQPDIDLEVIYLSDRGLTPFRHFGVGIQYDKEILSGYKSRFLGNDSSDDSTRSLVGHFLPRLWQILRRGRYDAVWVHGYNLPGHWLAFSGCWLSGIPILLRGESELLSKKSVWRRALKRAVLPPLFKRISGFLCIGSLNRDFYRFYGVDESRLHWMPYGIDNAWYGGASDLERESWRRQVRARLGIGEKTVVFINHSKHVPPKRPADVVRAFSQLSADADAVLLMTGEGERRYEVEDACRCLKPGHRVMLLGLQPYDELRKLLVASDILAFASEETWAMAVSEALPAGLAILCSDKAGGAVDLVLNGVNGYIYRSRNELELAGRMSELVENPSRVAEMKQASRLHSSAFSFEAMNEGLRSALRSAADPSLRSSAR